MFDCVMFKVCCMSVVFLYYSCIFMRKKNDAWDEYGDIEFVIHLIPFAGVVHWACGLIFVCLNMVFKAVANIVKSKL